MKKYYLIISIAIATSLLLVSCKKDTPTGNDKNIVYEKNIAGVKKNEAVSLTFSSNSNTTTKTIWIISPNNNYTIYTVGSNATLSFSIAGTYTVTAQSENVYAKYYITVIDSDYNDIGTKFTIVAPKFFDIKPGEPLVFKAYNKKAGSVVKWQFTVQNGGGHDMPDNINNTDTFTIFGTGYLQITASDGTDTLTRTVWINDTLHPNMNQDTVPFILGDRLQLTPLVINNKLVIAAKTTNNYNCATDKILSYATDDKNPPFSINYLGAAIAEQLCSPTNVASCSNSFSQIAVGTFTFNISYQNKDFSGTITKNINGKYKFTWSDNSLINIYPLETP